MSDRYGYIGIETLLEFCMNSKDHSITPNDFMRMSRIPGPKEGEWLWSFEDDKIICTACGKGPDTSVASDYCPNCGAKMWSMTEECEDETD